MRRIKQYLKAIRARVSEEDYKFLLRVLSKKELSCFNRFPDFEKRHALDVCYYIIDKYGIEDEELIKAALFHDIGKTEAKITPNKKAIAVILEKIPFIANFLRRYFFFLEVYYNHPKYSAKICREMGLSERVVYLVEHHHDFETLDEDVKKLQEADKKS